jgi:2-oxo-3-hexenedioate decarboxylase
MHRALLAAWEKAEAIEQLRLPSAEEGYKVQTALIEARLERGERLVGYKMGLTSKAKMAQVGVNEVIFGRLTDAMQVADGGHRRDWTVHPPAGGA